MMWSPILRLIGPSSPVVRPVFSHLKEIGATAEEDLLCPSVGLSKNQDLVAVSEDLMDKGVQDVSSDEYRCRVAKAEEQSCHVAEDPLR